MDTQAASLHQPVLLNEVRDWLQITGPNTARPAMLDCTLGAAGHSRMMLEACSSLVLVGLDRDPAAVHRGLAMLAPYAGRIHLTAGNFAELTSVLAREAPALRRLGILEDEQPLPLFQRVLVDLGISSDQLDDPSRGFSFLKEGPLDMRMNPESEITAQKLVNELSPGELTSVLRRGGVGKEARVFAREIVKQRPVNTTTQLADICRAAAPFDRRAVESGRKTHHPATVVFQALRIAVNSELDALRSLLQQVLNVLAPGGRLAIISFHSLEDRWVTRSMRTWSRSPAALRHLPETLVPQRTGSLLTSKAVVPGPGEITSNPRARSARMRVFERSAAAAVGGAG